MRLRPCSPPARPAGRGAPARPCGTGKASAAPRAAGRASTTECFSECMAECTAPDTRYCAVPALLYTYKSCVLQVLSCMLGPAEPRLCRLEGLLPPVVETVELQAERCAAGGAPCCPLLRLPLERCVEDRHEALDPASLAAWERELGGLGRQSIAHSGFATPFAFAVGKGTLSADKRRARSAPLRHCNAFNAFKTSAGVTLKLSEHGVAGSCCSCATTAPTTWRGAPPYPASCFFLPGPVH